MSDLLITNKRWQYIYESFVNTATNEAGYTEAIGFSFSFNPVTDHVMSKCKCLFNAKKAAKMFAWYKKADSKDASIIDMFSEYKNCIDKNHDYFNSNYGIYAYKNGGLKFCIDELKKNHKSRRACFCINDNSIAINDFEIDKLCTNAIQFFIRDARLEMVVQMRSSNFITLLPYDAFMFSVFYFEVYKALLEEYKILKTGLIRMQIASLHLYDKDVYTAYRQLNAGLSYSHIIDFDKEISDIEYKLNK
jgi:thymidylate synthase